MNKAKRPIGITTISNSFFRFIQTVTSFQTLRTVSFYSSSQFKFEGNQKKKKRVVPSSQRLMEWCTLSGALRSKQLSCPLLYLIVRRVLGLNQAEETRNCIKDASPSKQNALVNREEKKKPYIYEYARLDIDLIWPKERASIHTFRLNQPANQKKGISIHRQKYTRRKKSLVILLFLLPQMKYERI